MDKIAGPFGLWTFPILNFLHEIIQMRSLLLKQTIASAPSLVPQSFSPQQSLLTTSPRAIVNREEWEVKRDENGRLEGFVVHRKLTEEESTTPP